MKYLDFSEVRHSNSSRQERWRGGGNPILNFDRNNFFLFLLIGRETRLPQPFLPLALTGNSWDEQHRKHHNQTYSSAAGFRFLSRASLPRRTDAPSWQRSSASPHHPAPSPSPPLTFCLQNPLMQKSSGFPTWKHSSDMTEVLGDLSLSHDPVTFISG